MLRESLQEILGKADIQVPVTLRTENIDAIRERNFHGQED